MTLTRIKTYGNIRLMHDGALIASNTHKERFFQIKESFLYGTDGLKGGPGAWVLAGSCDSANYSMEVLGPGTDYITDRSKIVQSIGNHSWFVVRQPGLSNFEFCMDFNIAITYRADCFSSLTGFTGGAINARPTAADEIEIKSNGTDIIETAAAVNTCGVNCIKSTDGKVTRIISTRDSTISNRPLFIFEELFDVDPYWPSNIVAGVVGASMTGISKISNLKMDQNGVRSGHAVFDGISTSRLDTINEFRRPDYGGSWSVFPCGFILDVDTGIYKGRVGNFHDLWIAPDSMVTGEYLSGALNQRFEYVNIGGIIMPWDNTPLVLP